MICEQGKPESNKEIASKRPMTMNMYLIRHAQTTMNAQGKVFSGSTDVALSDKGIETARQMSMNRLWGKIAHVFITPLIRTRQTADILFGDGLGRTVVPELAEVDFGEYEGRIRDSTNANDPVFYKWVHDPENLTFPQGENLLAHAKASLKALTKIANENTYDDVAIVSHATTIRLLLATLLTGTIKCFRNVPCDNCCVSLIVAGHGALRVQYINAPL